MGQIQNYTEWLDLLIFSDTHHKCFLLSMSHSRYGPLINHWTTRFEAKHKYFKHLANVMGNFTNICYSLALRHQMYQCYLSINQSGLPIGETEIGPGTLQHNLYISIYMCAYVYPRRIFYFTIRYILFMCIPVSFRHYTHPGENISCCQPLWKASSSFPVTSFFR